MSVKSNLWVMVALYRMGLQDGAPGNVGVFAFSWDMAVAEFYSSWWIKTNINELVFMGFINLEI